MQKSKHLLLLPVLALILSCNHVKYPYGKRSFERLCGDCHMDDGSGVSSLYPSLSGNNYDGNYIDIPCIIRNGVNDSTSVIQMLPMPQVSEVDITNIINYIMNDLNQDDKEIFLPEVKAILEKCR